MTVTEATSKANVSANPADFHYSCHCAQATGHLVATLSGHERKLAAILLERLIHALTTSYSLGAQLHEQGCPEILTKILESYTSFPELLANCGESIRPGQGPMFQFGGEKAINPILIEWNDSTIVISFREDLFGRLPPEIMQQILKQTEHTVKSALGLLDWAIRNRVIEALAEVTDTIKFLTACALSIEEQIKASSQSAFIIFVAGPGED